MRNKSKVIYSLELSECSESRNWRPINVGLIWKVLTKYKVGCPKVGLKSNFALRIFSRNSNNHPSFEKKLMKTNSRPFTDNERRETTSSPGAEIRYSHIRWANKQSQCVGHGFVKCGFVKTCQAKNCKCNVLAEGKSVLSKSCIIKFFILDLILSLLCKLNVNYGDSFI